MGVHFDSHGIQVVGRLINREASQAEASIKRGTRDIRQSEETPSTRRKNGFKGKVAFQHANIHPIPMIRRAEEEL